MSNQKNDTLLPQLLGCRRNFCGKTVEEIVCRHPEVCAVIQKWDPSSKDAMLLLARICQLRPSFELVQAAYKAYPQALREKNSDGWFPLHIACFNQASDEVVRFLVCMFRDGVKAKDRQGRLPLHVACRDGTPIDVIRFLISEHRDAILTADKGGRLPLHNACYDGASPRVVSFLVSEHRDGMRAEDAKGLIPLHMACCNGMSPDIVCMLVAEDPNSIMAKTSSGNTPLHLALQMMRYWPSQNQPAAPDVANDERAPSTHGQPLNRAALGIVCPLISANNKIVKERDQYGNLTLHIAAQHRAPVEVIKCLVAAYRPSVKAKNRLGDLPLHLALKHRAPPDVIQYLVSEYEESVKMKDRHVWLSYYPDFVLRFMPDIGIRREGWLPLQLACRYRAPPKLIYCLLSKFQEGAKIKDDKGALPLHLALRSGVSPEALRYLVSSYPESLKANLNNHRGWKLPLQLAFASREQYPSEIIHFLLSEHRQGVLEAAGNGGMLVAGNVVPEHACLLASECPCILSKIFPSPIFGNPRWTCKKWPTESSLNSWLEGSEQFWAGDPDKLERQGAIVTWSDENDIIELIEMLQQKVEQQKHTPEGNEKISHLVAVGGMSNQTLQPILKVLRGNDTLLYLGLGNNPIQDAGAKSLAASLLTNKTLEALDVHDCSIGIAGLESLLGALKQNHVLNDLNLSFNIGIFNRQGGKLIAESLAAIAGLKKLHLYQESDTRDFESAAFLDELLCSLCWNSKSLWPILLNKLPPCSWQAIEHYRERLHHSILGCVAPERSLLWHFVLETVGNESQSNAELMFFYVRRMLV